MAERSALALSVETNTGSVLEVLSPGPGLKGMRNSRLVGAVVSIWPALGQ